MSASTPWSEETVTSNATSSATCCSRLFSRAVASEDGSFTLSDVIQAISDKMIRRHPHVFSDGKRRGRRGRAHAMGGDQARERRRPAAQRRRRYPRLCAGASAGGSPRREGEPSGSTGTAPPPS